MVIVHVKKRSNPLSVGTSIRKKIFTTIYFHLFYHFFKPKWFKDLLLVRKE